MQIPEALLNKYYNDNVKQNINNNVIDIENKADYLVSKLNNPESRPYYCKVAMNLSEADIARNLEIALTGRNPQRYFTWLCNRQLSTVAN